MMIKLTESKKILLKRLLLIPNLIRHADSHNTTLETAIKTVLMSTTSILMMET